MIKASCGVWAIEIGIKKELAEPRGPGQLLERRKEFGTVKVSGVLLLEMQTSCQGMANA
jgi:hypothetical protein